MCLFFFFKQKTAYEMRISDWSSDVCSADLGQQIPVASTIINPVLGGNDGNNSNLNASQVQFRQTGIVLTVRPRANPDGTVFLEVTQTVSSPSASGPVVGGNVSVDPNDVQTELLVRRGEQVIIAGLITTTQDTGERTSVVYGTRV